MNKIKLFVLMIFLSIVNIYGQEVIDRGLMKHYVNHSSAFKNLVQAYQDSSYNMFGCKGVNKLTFVGWLPMDSTKRYDLQGMLLMLEDQLKSLKKVGYVVVEIDSVNVFIMEDVLKKTPFSDSINYVGEKETILKYDSFERCLQNYGASDYIRFFFRSDNQYEIEFYEYYMPFRGKMKYILERMKYFGHVVNRVM